MIVLSIKPENFDEYLKSIETAIKYSVDLIELRLDNHSDEDIERFLKDKSFPKIITIRKNKYTKTTSDKLFLNYYSALQNNVEYIDLDAKINENVIRQLIKNKNKTKIILSYHNYSETPSIKKLKNIFDKLSKYQPDFIKIVTYANKITDHLKIYDLLEYSRTKYKKLIAHCMGNNSITNRILSYKLGSKFFYTSQDDKIKTADGQLNLNLTYNIFRINKINNKTKLFGIIGNTLTHSKSWIFHNLAFKYDNINAVYLNFEINNFNIFYKHFLKYLNGISITIPFKEIVAKKNFDKSSEVEIIGSANTLINNKNNIKLYNTDYSGFLEIIKNEKFLQNSSALVIGAGGSARSVIIALLEYKNKVFCINRHPKRAKTLSKELGCSYLNEDEFHQNKYDILVNTTPADNDYLINLSEKILTFQIPKIVVDLNLHSAETKFLSLFKIHKVKLINGYVFFLSQAKIQSHLFAKIKPNLTRIKKFLVNY